MITLVVTYCMVMNPTMCRELEMVPLDHAMASIPECLHGGVLGSVSFTMEHIEWQTKGFRCRETQKLTTRLESRKW
jgi:hypothetical protein